MKEINDSFYQLSQNSGLVNFNEDNSMAKLDSFDYLILNKALEADSELRGVGIEKIECCGSDHRFTKYTGFIREPDYEDEDGQICYGGFEPVQFFVDRADGYKTRFLYGHEGWLV